MYLLDDPLSAVDAHVGAGLFAQGIVNALKNRGKGVILGKHSIHKFLGYEIFQMNSFASDSSVAVHRARG